MVRKTKRGSKSKKVGKIQIVVGIILLIVCIIGLLITYMNYKQSSKISIISFIDGLKGFENSEDFQDYSNESLLISKLSLAEKYAHDSFLNKIISLNLVIALVLGLLISILFITQGLVNMGEGRR